MVFRTNLTFFVVIFYIFSIKNKMKKILFYGVCGVSMSALAILSTKDHEVWGYDDFPHDVEFLSLHKIKLLNKIDAHTLLTFDEIIYTNAILKAKQLIEFAKKNNKTIYERAEFLGKLSQQFENVIAISGTHGKTTTTAMVGAIFQKARLNPTVHVGGTVSDWMSNFLLGEDKYFITEACEFNKSFLALKPDVSVITNIEPEHLDTYANYENELDAFKQFATQSKTVICGENVKIKPSLTYGMKPTNYVSAINLTQTDGKFKFDCVVNHKTWGSVQLKIMGQHNVENALASIAVALRYDMDFPTIKTALENFAGVERRLKKVSEGKLGTHFLDYAHHPTEIKATLDAVKNLPHKRIVAIFQPHTYSRTKSLMNEFCSCFDCDELYLLPTYPARESFIAGGDSLDLFYNLNGKINCKLFNSDESLFYDLKENLCVGDIVVWLGAGNIDKICYKFKNKL